MKPHSRLERVAGPCLCLCVLLTCNIATPARALPTIAKAYHYPGKTWERIQNPDHLGWSRLKLRELAHALEILESAALIIVHRGRIAYKWGETVQPPNIYSIRKSLLSALIGLHIAKGELSLDSTLAELGIDDYSPVLTHAEKQATVRDLITARSGVYHPAAYETSAMKGRRLQRGCYAPGTYWYYNNWDFNALGTIFVSSQ